MLTTTHWKLKGGLAYTPKPYTLNHVPLPRMRSVEDAYMRLEVASVAVAGGSHSDQTESGLR